MALNPTLATKFQQSLTEEPNSVFVILEQIICSLLDHMKTLFGKGTGCFFGFFPSNKGSGEKCWKETSFVQLLSSTQSVSCSAVVSDLKPDIRFQLSLKLFFLLTTE